MNLLNKILTTTDLAAQQLFTTITKRPLVVSIGYTNARWVGYSGLYTVVLYAGVRYEAEKKDGVVIYHIVNNSNQHITTVDALSVPDVVKDKVTNGLDKAWQYWCKDSGYITVAGV